jgi:1,4-dihydroxy-2-naphthoate octaprenyltransferase
MKNYMYKLLYLITIIVIILLLVLVNNMNEMVQMILGAIAIILTSMFTYSIKDDIPYRRNKKDDTK